MNVVGMAMDWVEEIADAVDDPEARSAGSINPSYPVSPEVNISLDHGLYVYHLGDDQLGQGSSLGNAHVWAETKGNGDMLSFYSIDAGTRVMGGISVTYLLPFSDISAEGMPLVENVEKRHDSFARLMPSSPGTIHLHPAYQQREFIIGDGLHVLETFFVPRTGLDDPAVAHSVVVLRNRTPHPIGITCIASLQFRGNTPIDLTAGYDAERGALVAHNASQPEWVRVFGSTVTPSAYWATTDEEEAYSPGHRLPDETGDTGDLTGALQFDIFLLPGQRHKIPLTTAFSAKGRAAALATFDSASQNEHSLKETIKHYTSIIQTAALEMPDALLTQGVQWAKACLIRPVSRYAIGLAFTNNPGWSSSVVGRDTAWYTQGCDFVIPQASCAMLEALAQHQRPDGLLPEFINGNTGKSEDWSFNINDDTPLFVMAVAHHIKATGHEGCLEKLYEPSRRAVELLLQQRDGQGLVKCTADGMGAQGICGWRNVLTHDQINGVVTEVNAEAYAALCAFAYLAGTRGCPDEAAHYRQEAERLRALINKHLINPRNGLYVRNIDLQGRVYTQVTCDLVFPLVCSVADPEMVDLISARLSESDFMTEAGLRILPAENPSYDPSFESGCLGGVWPGVTWWFAMGCCRSNPRIMADSLRRSYSHYITDPKTYNTVPGQFSEWSDGETLVNRGMRLSPWEPPRYLWAAIEGVAGLRMGEETMALNPQLPDDWYWLRLHNLPFRDGSLSFFLTRQHDAFHVYTCNTFSGKLQQHRYEEELPRGAETLTTGLTTTVFRRGDEVLICMGSTREMPILGPFLAHHALDAGARYEVSRVSSRVQDWENLGAIGGADLQRVTVRVDARGYVLYRFVRVR